MCPDFRPGSLGSPCSTPVASGGIVVAIVVVVIIVVVVVVLSALREQLERAELEY